MARVLVVDDNPSNLKLIEFVLSKRGHEVTTAPDAAAALAAIEHAPPELILLDLQMPGVDGFTLAGRLRDRDDTRAVPIIAVTAYAMKGDRERALEAGCDAYMSKPIDTRGLPRLIDQLLGGGDS